DLSGIGESDIATATTVSAEDAALADASAAMDAMQRLLPCRHFVLGGLCSGAELAHRAAVTDARVHGVIALDGYIARTRRYYLHHYLPRLFSPSKWRDAIAHRLRRRHAVAQDRDELQPLAFWEALNPSRDEL